MARKRNLKQQSTKQSSEKDKIDLVNDNKPVSEHDVTVLSYPCYYGTLTIKDLDVRRIEEDDGWINDLLIDFSISRIIENREEVFMFPSSFYIFLYERAKVFDYENSKCVVNLRNKKIDIFQKDILLIPINYKFHWSLAVVVRPLLLVIGSKDEKGNDGMILCLDSLGTYHGKDYPILREQILRFLWSEWSYADYIRSSPFGEDSRFDSLQEFMIANCSKCFLVSTPEQQNGNDCGVFVVKYVENFLSYWPQDTKDADAVISAVAEMNKFITQDYISECGRPFLMQLLRECQQEINHVNLV